MMIYTMKPTQEKKMIQELIELAKNKYAIKISNCLPSMLGYFLYEINGKRTIFNNYTGKYSRFIRCLFPQEYLFATEVIQIVQDRYQVLAKQPDLIQLTEIIICSEWNLTITIQEQERFIDHILLLLKNISLFGGMPLEYMLAEEKGLINHIKFLAFRILKRNLDEDPSDDEIYFHIKENYKSVFRLVNRLRVNISEKYDFDLSNNEISYLCLQVQRSRTRYDHFVKRA